MDILDVDEARTLLSSLLRLTASGALEWKPLGTYTYVAPAGAFRFGIYSQDDDGLAPFVLQIRREKEDIDSINQTELSEDVADQLHQLFVAVRRKVVGADNVVRELFESLDILDEEPPF